MLIFDKFKDRSKADEFSAATNGKVYDNQEASNAVDPFPFQLIPPIVLVETVLQADGNLDLKAEDGIIRLVKTFKGTFAGT
jgi:hypothetical protein